jgi:hypothetical protein
MKERTDSIVFDRRSMLLVSKQEALKYYRIYAWIRKYI